MSLLGGKSGVAVQWASGEGAGRIGVLGPGEKKLETDRRRIRDPSENSGQHWRLRKPRACAAGRARVPLALSRWSAIPNAGNPHLSTRSAAEVLVSSRMFAPSTRTIRARSPSLPPRGLVSRAVGFIRDLPKGLPDAFRAHWKNAGGCADSPRHDVSKSAA